MFHSVKAPTRPGVAMLALLALGACAGEAPEPATEPQSVTVYSGRSERLVGPLLERFQADTGIGVEARYGSTAEMTATLMEEGAGSPAHVFLAQDGGALGALSAAGLLQRLDPELLAAVDPRFRSPADDWIGLSGRPRVVAYNTELTSPEDLPQSLDQVAEERFRGKFGLAPTNASFQAHMAVYGALNGSEALAALLAGIVANEPQTYDGNTAIVRAVVAGEIEWGLTNHYYLWRALAENPDAPGRNWFMPTGDASSFVNVAGLALLADNAATRRLAEYLVGEPGQTYFANETHEYPLAHGFEPAAALIPMSELDTPDMDFASVGDYLPVALRLIRESGLVP